MRNNNVLARGNCKIYPEFPIYALVTYIYSNIYMSNKQTLSTICALQIKDLLFKGELMPGDRIKGDYLRQVLGVGLSPIREGLSRLISTGLIECEDNVGFRVKPLVEKEIHDNYMSYIKLEILLLNEAISNGTEEWESLIMGSLFQLGKIEAKGVKVAYGLWSKRNDDFHAALISGARLNGLKEAHANLQILKDWYHKLANQNSIDELVQFNHNEHSHLAELAIARKAREATTLLEQHMLQSFNYLISKLRKQGYFINHT